MGEAVPILFIGTVGVILLLSSVFLLFLLLLFCPDASGQKEQGRALALPMSLFLRLTTAQFIHRLLATPASSNAPVPSSIIVPGSGTDSPIPAPSGL